MRYSFGFLCALALSLAPLVACTETTGDGGEGGSAGVGGNGGEAGSAGSGGSGGSGGVGAAGGSGGAGGSTMDCDPVAQTGCGSEEKCSQVVLVANPFESETRCVPDGTAQRGEQCSFGPSGDQGFDDCEGGLYCHSEQCMEICLESPDSCPSTEACSAFAGLFEDREGVGLCEFLCDPLLQDCFGIEEACYLIFSSTNARTACAKPVLDQNPGQQGDPCSSINTCAKGYGCGLQNDPINSTGLVCAFFCDSNGSGGPSCADGPGASLTCAEIRTFYDDLDAPAGLGICIDCTVWTEVAECQ